MLEAELKNAPNQAVVGDANVSGEQFNRENVFRCGSGSVDKRILEWATVTTVSLLTMAFCSVQIIRGEDAAIYLPMMTMVIGLHLNVPKVVKDKPK